MRNLWIVSLCCLLCLSSQAQQIADTTNTSTHKQAILTGFSGGMLLHIGYAFSATPDELFRNASLTSLRGLPSDGVTIGLGGALRLHLINHIHIGAEGFVSTMPLMKSGSNIRTGWGGALCDYYFTLNKVKPLLGITIGGGKMRRLYVPPNAEQAKGNDIIYNASYTTTSFFLLDPYVGMEIIIGRHASLMLKLDYMLPFGSNQSSLSDAIQWSKFITPSGPRLYVGIMFGHLAKK